MAVQILLLVIPVLIIAGVLAVTIHEHVTASALSLPIAPTLTGLVVALPLIAVVNALCLAFARYQQNRALGRANQRRITDGSDHPVQRNLSWTRVYWGGLTLPSITVLLQILQGALGVGVATLLIVNTLVGGRAGSSSQPSPLLRCALETTWQRFWSQHNAAAMQRIQDALQCCGFNSVVDRAWPFPSGGGGSVKTCAEAYGRTVACRVPWMEMARHSAGRELAVVIAVLVFQSATLLRKNWLFQGGHSNLFNHQSRRDLVDPYQIYEGDESHNSQVAVRRPLLADRAASAPGRAQADEDSEDDGSHGNGGNGTGNYVGGGETSGDRTNRRSGQNGNDRNGDVSNGFPSNAPRIEPSGLAGLPNEWNDV